MCKLYWHIYWNLIRVYVNTVCIFVYIMSSLIKIKPSQKSFILIVHATIKIEELVEDLILNGIFYNKYQHAHVNMEQNFLMK